MNLPDISNWKFDRFQKSESERVKKLENFGSAEELLVELETAFCKAIDKGNLCISRESAGKCPNDFRAVLQFYIGTDLFDWFFNGRTGYRAHYKTEPFYGLAFNAKVIERIENKLDKKSSDSITGWCYDEGFINIQRCEISKLFLVSSLHQYWSKIWCCETRISSEGKKKELKVFREPKIAVDQKEWAALSLEDDSSAWLDIKGGFVQHCSGILYQPKDPLERAKGLCDRGAA